MVYNLYYYLCNALQGAFIYLFFYHILDIRFKLGKDTFKLILLTIAYTVYMHYANIFIIEPIRSILSMFLLSAYFGVFTKLKTGYSFFVVFISRLITIGTMYIALFTSGLIVYYIFNVPDQDFLISSFVSLLIQAGLNILTYFTILKIKFSFIFYKDKDFGSPFISALTMMLFAYSSFHLLYDNKLSLLYWFLGAMFITGAVFFIMYIQATINKHNEKTKLTEKNDSLRGENHKLEDWLPGLDRWVKEKLSIIDDPKIRRELEKELALDQIPALMQNRLSQVHKNIKLPDTGLLALDGYFIERKEESLRANISFKVMVETKLNYLFERGIDYLCANRLVVNNVSNAFKELIKTEVVNKEIQIWFQINENSLYQISIMDNAHPFDLDVLANLGARWNSTNGTGYGWADNFELLAQCRASLEIIEYQSDGDEFTKKITILFDDKSEFNIYSYRQDEISARFNRSKF